MTLLPSSIQNFVKFGNLDSGIGNRRFEQIELIFKCLGSRRLAAQGPVSSFVRHHLIKGCSFLMLRMRYGTIAIHKRDISKGVYTIRQVANQIRRYTKRRLVKYFSYLIKWLPRMFNKESPSVAEFGGVYFIRNNGSLINSLRPVDCVFLQELSSAGLPFNSRASHFGNLILSRGPCRPTRDQCHSTTYEATRNAGGVSKNDLWQSLSYAQRYQRPYRHNDGGSKDNSRCHKQPWSIDEILHRLTVPALAQVVERAA